MARSPADPYYTESINLYPEPKIKEQWSWDEFLGGLAKGAVGGLSTGINLREMRDKAAAQRLTALRADPEFYLSAYDSLRNKDVIDTKLKPEQIPGRDVFPEGITTLEPETADLPGMGVPERTTPEQMGVDMRAAREARDRENARRRTAQSPEVQKFLENMTEGDALILRSERESGQRKLVANEIKSAAEEYAVANGTLSRLAQDRAALNAKAKSAYDAGDVDTASSFKQQAEAITKSAMDWQVKLGQARQKLEEHGISKEEYDTVLQPGKRDEAIDALIRKWARTGRTRRPGSK